MTMRIATEQVEGMLIAPLRGGAIEDVIKGATYPVCRKTSAGRMSAEG
ncbi:hypothetical protein [Yersinia ruckeri]|nr:hypothetical protein [Yersinia ruckeri]EKN4197705.1 hypothetical protein [Yersinia ruckeri]EKN4203957.1 hypothetical protein [Yersinia ruckeri]EKN4701117.1 hypothetical protein [Yersinia ruckeri]ELI6452148.1 hypothetical protein [Yersinia ruckeri]